MNFNFDPKAAQELMVPHIARYRKLTYAQLREKIVRGDVDVFEFTDTNDTLYQFEFLFL